MSEPTKGAVERARNVARSFVSGGFIYGRKHGWVLSKGQFNEGATEDVIERIAYELVAYAEHERQETRRLVDDALEKAALIADKHWPESGHVPQEGAISCAMSISVEIRRMRSDYPKPHPMPHPPAPVAEACAACGHAKDDPAFHFEAPGKNWGAALHHYEHPSIAPADYFCDEHRPNAGKQYAGCLVCSRNEDYKRAESIERRLRELREAALGLAECAAMWYTSFSGDIGRGENKKHVQCICCAADQGEAHNPQCHVAALRRQLEEK